MFNFTLRRRMTKIIKHLENKENILTLLENPKYLKAFQALEANSYVSAFYADGNDFPIFVGLGKKGPVYMLERFEIWCNRIAGFVCGIFTSVLAGMLLNLL